MKGSPLRSKHSRLGEHSPRALSKANTPPSVRYFSTHCPVFSQKLNMSGVSREELMAHLEVLTDPKPCGTGVDEVTPYSHCPLMLIAE
jgi:hypothetical protein